MKAHGMMFHYFHDNKLHIPSQGSISAEEMNAILDYYEENGYLLLTAGDWKEKAEKGFLKENEVCITFDDGLKTHFDIAHQVLQKRSLTAFYFIPTYFWDGGGYNSLEVYRHFRALKFKNTEEFYRTFFEGLDKNTDGFRKNITEELRKFDPKKYLQEFPFYTEEDKRFRFVRDKVMTEDEYKNYMNYMLQAHEYNPAEHRSLLWLSEQDIKTLHQTGNLIGLHSHSHSTILESYSYQKQKEEYSVNKEILEGVINERIEQASYPCNSYNTDTLKIMKELGIKVGFRANMAAGYDTVLEFPREDNANIIRRMRDENNRFYQ